MGTAQIAAGPSTLSSAEVGELDPYPATLGTRSSGYGTHCGSGRPAGLAAPSCEESQAVKRIIILSSLVTSAVWLVMTALAVVFVFPAVVDAQVGGVRLTSV